MDPLIATAAQALAEGDVLSVLKRVGLRDDAAALALRGIAMAQLGDFPQAKLLLRRAGRAFGPGEVVARARCVVAEAEIALVSRDLTFSTKALAVARQVLERHGDRLNAAHARHIEVRRLVLIGRLGEARQALAQIDTTHLPPRIRAAHELVVAGLAMRRLDIDIAQAALLRARHAARIAGHAVLSAEVAAAARLLDAPAVRLQAKGEAHLLPLREVPAVFATQALVVDACRHVLRSSSSVVTLARRPVLFALARTLGEAWPGDVSREDLVRRAFNGKEADESHRARLRVEIGRLRAELRSLGNVRATPAGYALAPRSSAGVVVLSPPADTEHPDVLALLSDGEAWSSSALALALSASPRTVQRALEALAASGKAQSHGRGRARRWTMPPGPGFTTLLLLPGPLAGE
jgi:hypothetical protein